MEKMPKTVWVLAIVATFLVALLLNSQIAPAIADDISCPPNKKGDVNDNIEVNEEGCSVRDANVDGNIYLDSSNESLVMSDSNLNGNIEGKDCGDIIVSKSTINGDIKAENCIGTQFGTLLNEVMMNGNVEIKRGTLQILGNSVIHGNVKCEEGTKGFFAKSVVIKGNLEGC